MRIPRWKPALLRNLHCLPPSPSAFRELPAASAASISAWSAPRRLLRPIGSAIPVLPAARGGHGVRGDIRRLGWPGRSDGYPRVGPRRGARCDARMGGTPVRTREGRGWRRRFGGAQDHRVSVLVVEGRTPHPAHARDPGGSQDGRIAWRCPECATER